MSVYLCVEFRYGCPYRGWNPVRAIDRDTAAAGYVQELFGGIPMRELATFSFFPMLVLVVPIVDAVAQMNEAQTYLVEIDPIRGFVAHSAPANPEPQPVPDRDSPGSDT